MKIKNMNALYVGLATLAAAFTSQSANANDITQLGSFYISGKISASTLEHTIERDSSTPNLPVQDSSGVFSNQETSLSGGLAVGYLHDIHDRFYLGAEGFYNFENLSSRNIAGVLVTDVDLNATYGGRAILGFKATDEFSFYVHAGATVLDFDITNSYTFAPPVRHDSKTETAFSFGAGVDYKVTENMSIFADYTQINDVSFGGIPEVAGGTGRVNDNELDLGTVSLGVKYTF